MSELLLNPSREVIKLNKQVLSFNVNVNSKIQKSECDIKVKNLTFNYLALRVKTTRKEEYAVNPNYCMILPDGEVTIHFIMTLKTNHFSPQKAKFKFEAIVIDNIDKDKDPKFLFDFCINSQKKIVGNCIKRGVEFITSYTKVKEAPEPSKKEEKSIEMNMDLNLEPKIENNNKMKVRGAVNKRKNVDEDEIINTDKKKEEKKEIAEEKDKTVLEKTEPEEIKQEAKDSKKNKGYMRYILKTSICMLLFSIFIQYN